MSDPKVQIKGLYKVFGDTPQAVMPLVREGISKQDLLEQHGHVLGLKDINIDIPDRRIQVIMGLSGSGKSTLIRHVNRLIEPTEGEILVDGENILALNNADLCRQRCFNMSMVFQKFALFPHRTIVENVGYGLEIQKVDKAEAAKRSAHWIDRVGLTGFENHYPGQLSGGMQQRVGLARALATDAEILLMDEAFSALDPLIRTDMQSILLELQEELHKTIIFITHDLDEALRLGDNIAILRDGEVIQQGDAQDIVLRPADDYISDFTREINRGRVIRLRALKDDVTDASEGTEPLFEGVVLEEALAPLAAADGKPVRLVDKAGAVTGQVDLNKAVAALRP